MGMEVQERTWPRAPVPRLFSYIVRKSSKTRGTNSRKVQAFLKCKHTLKGGVWVNLESESP